MSLETLHVTLDAPLPRVVATGSGTAVFVAGWCWCERGSVTELEFRLDGQAQPVMAHGMPRLDPLRETGEPATYRSGFWGLLRVPPPERDGREVVLELAARLDDGSTADAEVARLILRREPEPVELTPPTSAASAAGPRVAICMATYEPPADLLRSQIDSIRAQTHENWVCYVSDDASGPNGTSVLTEVIGDDPRFVVSRSPRRLGFVHNFERALSMVRAGGEQPEVIALADQDDHWYPEKLAVLLDAIGDAQLVYSDARIVDRQGRRIGDTYWSKRRNNHWDELSLLVANSVTGAASLFRADLLELALPFPPGQFAEYHDHWIAVAARSIGEIRFVDRPLYDYVQHSQASLGHERANQKRTLGARVRGLWTRGPRARIRKWRMHYFVDIARLLQVATVLELRCGDRMRPEARRVIARVLEAERSPALIGQLVARGTRELFGRPETLGAEWMLLFGLVWRWLVEATADVALDSRLRIDALPPTDLAPGFAHGGASPALPGSARRLADKIAPLAWRVAPDAPRRVNLLIPTIDLDHFFGGYIGKFNLAVALARRGHRVRILTVDPTPPLPGDWRARVEAFAGLSDAFGAVEVAFGREREVAISPSDRFVATTWWTAHIARDAAAHTDARSFLYLIQEYEPFTFPMGTLAALAAESYRFEHAALFSTELLRDYFRSRRLGVFAAGPRRGDRGSASFRNAITPVPAPSPASLAERSERALLFYARPEPHAERNLFDLGLLALREAVGAGAFGGWRLRGVGSVEREARFDLGQGAVLELLARCPQDAYADLLRDHDLGLALMYTPHPSLVPLEMASAGMLTVTNSFENKTAEALTALSPNLIVAEPTVEAVAAALTGAAAAVGDLERRVAGSEVDWPRSWGASFDEAVLGFVESALGL